MTWRLEQGHVLDVLRSLPSESVQMAVTSPPYWGLRAYGTEGQAWGGDELCAHYWTTPIQRTLNRSGGPGKQYTNVGSNLVEAADSLCSSCGAWRGELGSEPTIALFIEHLVAVFGEVHRVLKNDGTLWLNIGDSYAGSGKGPSNSLQPDASQIGNRQERPDRGLTAGKTTVNMSYGGSRGSRIGSVNGESGHTSGVTPTDGLKAKDLCLIPERLALALQDAGWYVRSRIAWCKTSAMPESVRDRPTSAWEHIWLLSKSAKYFYDMDAVREPLVTPLHRPGNTAVYGEVKRNDFGSDAMDREWGTVLGANQRNYWDIADKIEYGESPTGREVLRGLRANPAQGILLDTQRRRDLLQVPPVLRSDGDEAASDPTRYVPGEPNSLPTKRGRQGSKSAVLGIPERGGSDSKAESKAETPEASDRDGVDGDGLAGDPGRAPGLVRVLRDDNPASDDGSRDSDQQGRGPCERECCTGVPPMQQPEEGQDSRVVNTRWLLGPDPYSDAHFATFPREIPRRAIAAGSRAGDTVLDPFAGSGTTLFVAEELGRNSIGIELNPAYCRLVEKRMAGARTPLPGLLS